MSTWRDLSELDKGSLASAGPPGQGFSIPAGLWALPADGFDLCIRVNTERVPAPTPVMTRLKLLLQ